MKVGIVGCGYVCDTYMSTWGRHPKLVLAGVADRDPGRAEAIATRYGLRRYATNAELFADPEIGVVVNLTSIASHAEVTRDALNAGKHVYSEKPLVLSVEDGLAIKALAEAKGLRVGCAPDTFMGGAHQQARAMVDEGVIGTVTAGTARSTHAGGKLRCRPLK